jgi:NADH-quinone oxidoreductase subunit H
MMTVFIDIAIKAVLAFSVLFIMLNIAGLLTWVERKQSALIQDRIGANRAYVTIPGGAVMTPVNWLLRKMAGLGLLHPLADVLKMLSKEDYIPSTDHKGLHWLAPFVAVFFALIAFAAIPIGHVLPLGGRMMELRVARIDAGVRLAGRVRRVSSRAGVQQ